MENEATILVVDDTETNIDILVELLSDLYEVMVALDGESALEIVAEEKIDLILLDIMMPGMDGYAVCKALKSGQQTEDIPIIFITANTDEDSIEKAYECGGIDYVTKPFKPRELLARVNRELKMQELIRDLRESRAELKKLAITDPMTKLYNRRYFTEISTNLFKVSRREHKELSVIMLDIDKFKRVNDTFGHQVGDSVIILLADILTEQKRKSDIACRYGGEEFVLLLPNADLEGSRKLAEKIRETVQANILPLPSGESLQFTVSLGIAQVDLKNEKNLEAALSRADEGLYAAKDSGRNRVCCL
jgi:diguanylate cyclase (GGDEF)-like protein